MASQAAHTDTLTTGRVYTADERARMTLLGWTPASADTHGYTLADYFGATGVYLGADADGIEPLVVVAE